MAFHQDFKDLLEVFAREKVRYLLVGGYAVAFHSRPRFTKDIDLWVDGSPENVERTARALESFGVPVGVVDAWRAAAPDEIVYFGHPPVRVDLLREVPGVKFDEAFSRRETSTWEETAVSIIELVRARRR